MRKSFYYDMAVDESYFRMAQKAQTSLLNGAHNASDALEKEARKRKEELKKKEISKPKDDPKKKALKPIQVKSLNLTAKKTRN